MRSAAVGWEDMAEGNPPILNSNGSAGADFGFAMPSEIPVISGMMDARLAAEVASLKASGTRPDSV